jgi:hypothetical protein
MAGRRGGSSLLGVGLAAFLAGCASVPTGGAMQSIEIDLGGSPGGGSPGVATCVLSNGDAEWTASAPGRVVVTTGAGPLRVKCRADDGRASGEAVAEPQVRGGRVRRTLIGAGSGVLAGGAFGALTYQPDPGSFCCGRDLAVTEWAVIGALVGAAIGAGSAKPAYEYPARIRVQMQADASPR